MEFTTAPSCLTELDVTWIVRSSVKIWSQESGYWKRIMSLMGKDLALYEIGKVFKRRIKRTCQMKSTALPLLWLGLLKKTSRLQLFSWFLPAKESWKPYLLLGSWSDLSATSENHSLHPGRAASISLGDQVLGLLEQNTPYDGKSLHSETYVAELNTRLSKQLFNQPPFVKLRSSNSQRDIALLLKAEVTHQVVDAIKLQAWNVGDLKLFDVFSGEKLGTGMKSMALIKQLSKIRR